MQPYDSKLSHKLRKTPHILNSNDFTKRISYTKLASPFAKRGSRLCKQVPRCLAMRAEPSHRLGNSYTA